MNRLSSRGNPLKENIMKRFFCTIFFIFFLFSFNGMFSNGGKGSCCSVFKIVESRRKKCRIDLVVKNLLKILQKNNCPPHYGYWLAQSVKIK